MAWAKSGRIVGFGGDGMKGLATYTPILNISFFPSHTCMS